MNLSHKTNLKKSYKLDQISNEFVRNYFSENSLTLIDYNEEKHWGGYYIFEATNEYDRKLLRVASGQILSLQFHGQLSHPGHHETWQGVTDYSLFLSDRDFVGLSSDQQIEQASDCEFLQISAGERIEIPGGYAHALANFTKSDMFVLETRRSQISENYQAREANITRIFDTAERPGTINFPEHMLMLSS